MMVSTSPARALADVAATRRATWQDRADQKSPSPQQQDKRGSNAMLPLAAPLLLDQALSPPVFLDGIAPSLLFCFLGNEVFLHSHLSFILTTIQHFHTLPLQVYSLMRINISRSIVNDILIG
jgi:hypothetical protein